MEIMVMMTTTMPTITTVVENHFLISASAAHS